MSSYNKKKIEQQKWKKIENRARQSGFSLIELILVLAISSIAFLGFLNMEKRKVEVQNSENAGLQVLEVGQALRAYLNQESTLIKATLPIGAEALLPMTALTTPIGMSGPYPNHQLLPTTYQNATLFNTTLSILIKNSGGNIINGLVITNAPVVDTSGAVRFDYIGAAIKKVGPQGGMTFQNPTTLNGLAGGWTLSNADFAEINQRGLFGYRVQYQGDYDAAYLRLDGAYPMTGNLNMGNYSLTNATDISYSGWLYGNNATIHNLASGNIVNSNNIQTQSINQLGALNPDVATGIASSGNPNYANFDYMYTRCINCGVNGEAPPVLGAADKGTVRIGSTGNRNGGDQASLLVNDILLGNGASKGDMSNANLSDRLSRYVDRGIVKMSDGQTLQKPGVFAIVPGGTGMTGYACNYRVGKPAPIQKIELIPQTMPMVTGVTGPAGINSYDAGGGFTGIYFYQDQQVQGGQNVYASDLGWGWQVTANDGNGNAGTVLAHIYCDYGV
jgi:prepilin-type N-terminal cleavage/methylation domain-containing protein